MKILIRNLSRSTTEKELYDLFEVYGAIQSCNLVMDKVTGESKGFGFIEMPSPGEAKAAVKMLNNKAFSGSKIRVKKAEPKPVKNAVTENKPVAAKRKSGRVTKPKPKPKPKSTGTKNQGIYGKRNP